jgi:hypothetical protein
MSGPFHRLQPAWPAPHFKVLFRILRTIANSFVAGQRCSPNACYSHPRNGPSHCTAPGGRTSPPIRTTGSMSHRFLFNMYTDPAVILCSGSRYGGSFTTRRFDKCFRRPRNSFPLECCPRFFSAIEFSVGTPEFWWVEAKREFFNSHACSQQLSTTSLRCRRNVSDLKRSKTVTTASFRT